jgi:ubiquinone/menaquinone biosynthesis C-methylase UbiE
MLGGRKMINYDIASKTYDHTRNQSDRLIERFVHRVSFKKETAILDFGCGTGNYLNSLQLGFACRCCGVEPSDGMRTIAAGKNNALDVRQGDHRKVPFDDEEFDFVFMTDVIHHVPDLSLMFSELLRVLKPSAFLCVVTESHVQIQSRFYNGYFPSLAANEKRRYPEIRRIMEVAVQCGFTHEDTEMLPASSPGVITDSFVKNVEEKNFSMFRLLDEREFNEGLRKIRMDVGRSFELTAAGETLIWFRKNAQQTHAPNALSRAGDA